MGSHRLAKENRCRNAEARARRKLVLLVFATISAAAAWKFAIAAQISDHIGNYFHISRCVAEIVALSFRCYLAGLVLRASRGCMQLDRGLPDNKSSLLNQIFFWMAYGDAISLFILEVLQPSIGTSVVTLNSYLGGARSEQRFL